MNDLERQVLEKLWFYRFTLPSGATTRSYDDGALDLIHSTRLTMMDQALARHFPQGLAGSSAVDLACHQGYFSSELARRGAREVLALDARPEHVADATLIARTLGLPQIRPTLCDVHEATPERFGVHPLVLCFGLIYHLENPIGALRRARALCSKLCLIETQVVPHMGGMVDWGSYRFVRPLKGVFGIIDEIDETHAPEASTTGICLAPSVPGLLWVLHKVGFREVEVLPVPEGGYEQLVHGKRVMVAARV